MQTPSFEKGLEKLEKIASKKRCAIMCAEANPFRCHRSLIFDALTVRKNGKHFTSKAKKLQKSMFALLF